MMSSNCSVSSPMVTCAECWKKSVTLDNVTASEIMTVHPKTITPDALAVEALDLLRQYDITQLVVCSGNQYLGIIHLHDLVREGLI